MEILRVSRLSFRYEQYTIFDNVNFSIRQGDFVCVSGSNGTGKSTLIKLMLGLLTPTGGSVTLSTERYAYVSQKATAFNQSFPATVEEIVALGLFGVKPEKSDPVAYALDAVGMGAYRRQSIGALSGGQQQRVLLAKALVSEPALLFLDEPTTGIDNASTDSLCCMLGELNKNGLTVLMVTHDLRSIMDHAAMILHLPRPGVLECVPPEQFLGGTGHI